VPSWCRRRVPQPSRRLTPGLSTGSGQNDQLVIQDDDIPIRLKLIDEKLYTGWSTNKKWDVGTRSER